MLVYVDWFLYVYVFIYLFALRCFMLVFCIYRLVDVFVLHDFMLFFVEDLGLQC